MWRRTCTECVTWLQDMGAWNFGNRLAIVFCMGSCVLHATKWLHDTCVQSELLHE